jgi:mRNA-degrading endonuclease RelE of RelBE toxin-antitoxin system
MSEADVKYEVTIHKRALAELRGIPDEDQSRMKDRLKECGETEQPTDLNYVESLDNSDLFRVRVVDWRAICCLDKPELRVLAVGDRDTIYQRIQTAIERGEMDG